MASFSDKLSALRKELGVSQRTAAAELGISQALLSHYEKGIREPGLDFVSRACTYYGVTADYLLGLTDKKYSGVPPELFDDIHALLKRQLAGAQKGLSELFALLGEAGDTQADTELKSLLGKKE